MRRSVFWVSMFLFLFSALPAAWAQVPPPPDGADALSDRYPGRAYSPYAGRGFPSRPFWGDTHLHTSLSMDAGAFGNRLGLRSRRVGRNIRGIEEASTGSETALPLRSLRV